MSTFHPVASSLANYNGTILTIPATQLFCHVHVLPKRCRGFGMWSIFTFVIKHILGNKCIFPCSFGNKRMCLLTRVYGIECVCLNCGIIDLISNNSANCSNTPPPFHEISLILQNLKARNEIILLK